MKADLHVHTTASDGRLTPEEIVQKASRIGIEVIAITDHDTVEGIAPALDEARAFPELTVIPGVEINASSPEGEVHILGYFVDHTAPGFTQYLADLRDSRLERGRKMVAKLADLGMTVDWEAVLRLAAGGAVGRPHIAQIMMKSGYISSLREAFTDYIGRNGPAYVERRKSTPHEAAIMIVRAGGLPVLAHPGDIEELDTLVGSLKEAGLAGIEVFYSNYSATRIARLEQTAARHGLISTGGSDYHGLDKSIGSELGSVHVPRETVERLISLGGSKGE